MKNNVRILAKSAIFSAAVFLMTYFVSVPSVTAVGNVNLGDCAVLLSAWFLPTGYAFCAAGIGSALADIMSPYAVYAPATFLIKGLMALVASLIFAAVKKKGVATVVSGIVAEIIMLVGYFAFESIFICGAKTALLNIPFNSAQGVAGLVSGVLVFGAIGKVHRK